MSEMPPTYVPGLKIAIHEAEKLLKDQAESVGAMNAKARSFLGSASLILAIVGTFQLMSMENPSIIFKCLIGYTFLLYAVLILLAALVQQPLTIAGPISHEWDEIHIEYAKDTEMEMLEQHLSDILNAIETNKSGIEFRVVLTQILGLLLPIIVVFLLVLTFVR